MQNQIKIFENHQFGNLEVFMFDGKPYFPASECAKMLGYTNANKAIIDHCRGVTKRDTPTVNQHGATVIQKINYIPEGDLYRLIIRSKLPTAAKFEAWVFDEVLPSIRNHGIYATDDIIDRIIANPDLGIQLFTQLKEERRRNAELTESNDVLETALNESLKFYTVAKYNNVYKMGWSLSKCQEIGKHLSGFCRARSIEIRKCETNDERFGAVNSYPITAWEEFLEYAEVI